MDSDDIKRICHEASRFSRKAGWEMRGLPIICWQFATIADFARAKADLLMAMTPYIAPIGKERERLITGEVAELECFGIIFRLSCSQQYMDRSRGPLSANEVPVIFRRDLPNGL